MNKQEFDKIYWECVEELIPTDEQALASMHKIVGGKKTVSAMEMATFAYIESVKYTNDLVHSVLSRMISKAD